MLDEVACQLGASAHDFSDPIDAHVLRGVCLVLPILQSRDDVQVHIHTRNGVCALATWFSRLLGFVVEVTQRQGGNKDSQPSIVRLGRRVIRIDVKIDAVSEENPCVMLKGLQILTEINNPALLAEMGDNYKRSPNMLSFRRGQNHYRIDQDGNIFEYEKTKTFLRIYPNFWLDKKVHGVTRRPVKGLGGKMLEWAATAFAGAAGNQGHNEWIRNLRYVTIAFALDVAVHLRKSSVQLVPDESVTTNDIHPRFNDGFNDNGDLPVDSHMYFISRRHVLEAARLIFDDQNLASTSDEPYQSVVDNLHLEKSSLGVAKDLGVLLLTFANAFRFDSYVGLPLHCEFSLLDDQALVRRIRTWDGSSSISVQENDWFEIVARLLVGRSEVVDSETLKSTSLLSDHGWSIYRPGLDLRKDPCDTGESLLGVVRPATRYIAGLTQLMFC